MSVSFFDRCTPALPWRFFLLRLISLVLMVIAVPLQAKPASGVEAIQEKLASAEKSDLETIMGFPGQVKMFVGDIKLFHLKNPIKTVAVGNGKVLSSSTIENGDLMVLAVDAGDTTVHVWNALGQHFVTRIRVDLKDMDRVTEDVKKALGDTAGLTVRAVGERVLIEGQHVTANTTKLVDAVVKLYPQATNMTTSNSRSELLEPMIIFDLHFIEFKKSALQNIGVKWDAQSTGGFNFGYFSDFILNDAQGNGRALRSDYKGYNPVGKTQDKFSLNAAFGFGSAINLAITNGDAYVLAAPKLSARSGGKAKFLSGGEIPLQSIGANGTVNIIFKQYGIILNLEANAIGVDGISGAVLAEVSTLDTSISVQGLPGFLTRRTESEFNMKDGETLVLSGLLDKENAKAIDKVPLLGNIPIIGEFFKNKQVSGKDSELVVFITPRVFTASSEINRRAIEQGTSGLNLTSTLMGDGNVLPDSVKSDNSKTNVPQKPEPSDARQ